MSDQWLPGQAIDRPPGSTTILRTPAALESANAAVRGDEDDFHQDLFESVRPITEMLEATRRVAWPRADSSSPCYAHLLVDGGDNLKVDRNFELGQAELELLLAANRYLPNGHYGIIAFGLRGARLRNGEKHQLVDRLPLEDTRPDHVHFQCVIGLYFRKQGTFSAYTASTVPWHGYMAAGTLQYNLLPTGCYIYKKGTHRPETRSRWVEPALRLSDAEGSESGLATVLRTKHNAIFGFGDEWSLSQPSDNIHCAYSDSKFSSLGCQTVKGGMHDGLWAEFQGTLRTLPASARVDYVLATGAECAIAGALVRAGRKPGDAEVERRLGRLRVGSEGDAVRRLQKALGQSVTGYFGPRTKKALTEAQSANGLQPDGIYAPATEAKLSWDVFAGASAGRSTFAPSAFVSPAPSGSHEPRSDLQAAVAPSPNAPPAASGAPAPPTSDPQSTAISNPITPEVLKQIAPRPRSASQAAIWDKYVKGLASREGGYVFAHYKLLENPQRLAFILANMLAETGGLTLVWESMNYSAPRLLEIFGRAAGISSSEAARLAHQQKEIADRVYGIGNPRKARELGNREPGDGWRYRGGGYLQTTGRENYRKIGERIGVDLEGNPELIEDAIVSLKAACAEWHDGGLNEYADAGSFRACCNGINYGNPRRNGAPIGFKDRLQYLHRCLTVFGLPMPKRAPGALESMHSTIELGDIGPEVEELQSQLVALGYDAGPPDGLFTQRTMDAVLAFQARNDLPLTGRGDGATLAALASVDVIALERERHGAGVPDGGGHRHGARPKSPATAGIGWAVVLAVVALLGLLATIASMTGAGHAVLAKMHLSPSSLFSGLAVGGWLVAAGTGLAWAWTRQRP